jgi:hypothetical protein
VGDVGYIDGEALTIAILAAEKYNRSAFERRLKTSLASLVLGARGKLPEFSLGLAQIRPTTARHVLEEEFGRFPLSDRDLLMLLVNTCQNTHIASRYVEALIRQFASAGSIGDVIARVAGTYSGGATPTIGGLGYLDAVTGAYNLLTWGKTFGPEEEKEESGKPRSVDTCAPFAIGSIEAVPGDINAENAFIPRGDLDQEQKFQVSRIDVYLWVNDPGPKSYLALLASRRQTWLMNQLLNAEYTRDQIAITEVDSPKSFMLQCQAPGVFEAVAGIEYRLEPR